MKYDYNVIVIGGGAAGLVSSYIAAATKAKVALIETDAMGGDCLNTGCIPSKALIHLAQRYHDAQQLTKDIILPNFSDIMAQVHQKITAIEPHDSVERYSKLGVDCITAYAQIVDPHTVSINDKMLHAKSIIIATGASPSVPTIEGLEESGYLTSNTLWKLNELPEKLLILGGGAIGCELAQAFARLGSDVTIAEGAQRLLPREDNITSSLIEQTFNDENITILTGHRATKFSRESPIKRAHFDTENGEQEASFTHVLIALGRTPNVDGFGLKELGVTLSSSGSIDCNALLRTNVPSIYVCGDVAGPYQFTHMASHQAWYASVNALFNPLVRFKVDYSIVPRCTFTAPQIAHVGLTQQEADAQNIPYQLYHYAMSDLDRAIVDENNSGFIQVLCPPKKDRIIGATIVNAHGGEMIAEFIFAMKHNLGLKRILQTPHIYPTYNEGNKYLAGKWKLQNTPEYIYPLLRAYHKFRRK